MARRKGRKNPADLRPLPYREGALDPVIDADTVRRHHGTHQAGYVKGWNKTEKRLDANRRGSGGMLRASYESLVFNGAGVILHEMYWENLAPPGKGGNPSGHLLSCIKRCFGSVANLAHQMIEVGANIRGSGWVILAWVPRFDRMVVLPVQEHEMRWIPGAQPLIVLDVWEHAYYKQYGAGRKEYLKKLFSIINWHVVSQRYGHKAKKNSGYRHHWGAHGAHGPFPQAEGGYFPPLTRINPEDHYDEIAGMLKRPPSSWRAVMQRRRLHDTYPEEFVETVLSFTPSDGDPERSFGRSRGVGAHVPPPSVRAAALKGLRLSYKHNYSSASGIGIARAIQLVLAPEVDDLARKRMKAYFGRHLKDQFAKNFGNDKKPSRGYLAWLNWGGDPGREWVK